MDDDSQYGRWVEYAEMPWIGEETEEVSTLSKLDLFWLIPMCGSFAIFVILLGEGIWNVMHAKRPVVVCLCGSTKFRDAYEKANRDETLQGKVVLSVGLFGHHEGLDMGGPTKQMLDELHLRKIDIADEVLFLNVGGYLGESSKRELEYATGQGKKVRFLEDWRHNTDHGVTLTAEEINTLKSNVIETIRMLRTRTGLGLKECKELVDAFTNKKGGM